MNPERMRYMRHLLVKAAVQLQELQFPEWKFDGMPVETVKDAALVLGVPLDEVLFLVEEKDSNYPYPGYGGSLGPFKSEYSKPHKYARDVQSGAGNCVCGRSEESSIHPDSKDVHAASGAGTVTVGIGTRMAHVGIHRRANALACRNRRKRRHHEGEAGK